MTTEPTLIEERHAKLLDRGWTWIYARDLMPLEWVQQWSDFKMLALQTLRIGDTIYVRFKDDHLPHRHWPQNYRIRVNYPRPEQPQSCQHD